MDNEEILIIYLQSYKVNKENIPIELVIQIKRVLNEINQLNKPVFVNQNKESIMDKFSEFKYTGLNNADYIATEFYLTGWDKKFTIENLCKEDLRELGEKENTFYR